MNPAIGQCQPGDPCVGDGLACNAGELCCNGFAACPASGICGVAVPEIWVLDISQAAPVLKGTLNLDGSVLDVSGFGTGAALATDRDVMEYAALDLGDPAQPRFVPDTGIDLPDIQDGRAVSYVPDTVLLGRQSLPDEDDLLRLILRDRRTMVPPQSTEGLEMGAGVTAVHRDPYGCYAFAGTERENQELRVISLKPTPMSVRATFDIDSNPLTSGPVTRDLAYDPFLDRVILLSSNQYLRIIAPGEGSDPCL